MSITGKIRKWKAAMVSAALLLGSALPAAGDTEAEAVQQEASPIAEAQVTGFQAVSGTDGVTLTWNPVEGAFGYIIGSIHNGSPYAQLGWTRDSFYSDREASLTEYSYYWVFPFARVGDRNVRGKASDGYRYGIRTLPAVSGFRADQAENAVNLSWNAVNGAAGYIVKARRGSGAVEILADVPGTSFTDQNALSDAYNFYWVYAYVWGQGAKRPGLVGQYTYAKAWTPSDEMKNALGRAKVCVAAVPMSGSRLGEQLLQEGFSADAVQYAVQNCGAVWTEEALEAAENMAAESSFSRQAIRSRLEGDLKFSAQECDYAMQQLAADWNAQAVRAVSYYLNESPRSRAVIQKLLIDAGKFTESEAAYGTEHAAVDWKEQAAACLRSHLEQNPELQLTGKEAFGALVRGDLFTEEEAQYALNALGLTQ